MGFPAALTRLMIVALVIITAGCAQSAHDTAPLWHVNLPSGSIELYADSIVVKSEGSTVVKSEGFTQVLKNKPSVGAVNSPILSGSLPFFDSLANAAMSHASDSGFASSLNSYQLIALLPLGDADESQQALRSLVDSEQMRVMTVGHTSSPRQWPMSDADRLIWAQAAKDLYFTHAHEDWGTYAAKVIDRSLTSDLRVLTSPDSPFMLGIPALDSLKLDEYYAPWMLPAEKMSAMSFRVNLAAQRALCSLALLTPENSAVSMERRHNMLRRANELGRQLLSRYWVPRLSMCASALYGLPDPVSSPVADVEANLLAAATGAFSPSIARDIIRSVDPSTLSSLQLASLAVASAEVARSYPDDATGFSSLMNCLILLSRNLNSGIDTDEVCAVSSLVIKALFGITSTPGSLKLRPVVPAQLHSGLNLTGFRWRNATLNITIVGSGSRVSDITLDSRTLESNEIPASLIGEHNVVVNMTMASNETRPVKPAEPTPTAQIPPVPAVNLSRNRLDILNYSDTLSYVVIDNGHYFDNISSPSLSLPTDSVARILMIEAENREGITGWSARPLIAAGNKSIITLQPEETLRHVSRGRAGRNDAKRFVELSPDRNLNITLTAEVPSTGEYLISLHYAAMPRSGCAALRTLFVNGLRCGTFILPPPYGGEGWSNTLKATLRQGSNTISLIFMLPDNLNPDDARNTLLLDCVRMIHI